MKYLYFFTKIKNIALGNKKTNPCDLSALRKNFFVSNRQKNNRSTDADISQTLERGRSMIEMLGVLVIMGLLSVGGIWGYQYAMGIYRAGQIQDIMAQAKALTVTKRTSSQNSLSSFLDKTAVAGLNPTLNIVETADTFGRTIRIYTITLNNVEEHVQRFAYARKPNFAKMDIMLAPSADAVEETDQSKESWIDAGMSEGEYDILQQYSSLQSGKSLLFAYTTRSRRGITGGNDGDGDNAPTECPADMPFYDEATDSCSRCDVSLNEYWDPTQMKCIACTEPQDYWDETNYVCSCPPGIPVYDSATNTCVECLVDTDCKDEAKPVCNAEHKCEPCPAGQFYDGTECRLNCKDKKIWDREKQACVCDPTYYDTDANGYCVCRTDEVVATSIKSNGLNVSGVYTCLLHIKDLGKLKGTYYFKWTSGVHLYNLQNRRTLKDGVLLLSGTGATGKSTDNLIGPIFSVDMGSCPLVEWHGPANYFTGSYVYLYDSSCMEKRFSVMKPKYFTFDGTKMISLWFYDFGPCDDNGGTLNVELRKVISSCPEAGGGSEGGSSNVECTTNADCTDSSKPICNESYICEACPTETPYWNGTECIACTDTAPIWNAETKACEACPTETPHWNGTQCIACSDNAPVWNDETKACEPCPNDTPHWNGTTCIVCSDSAPIWNEETKECEACPDQTPHWNGTACIACSDSKPIWNTDTKECEACPNNTPYWNGTTCIDCSDSKPIWNTDTKECETCPSETPHWNGATCIACSDDTPIWNSSTKTCDTCPSDTPYWNGNACIACSDETPIWNEAKKICEACPYPTPVWNGTECEECPESKPAWDGNQCEACPANTPYWNESEMDCEACPIETPHWDGIACVVCPDEIPVWTGSECVECAADSDCAGNTDGRTICNTDTNTCQKPEMMCPIGDYYEYATEAEAQWCVENCPEHFKKGNTCYSCYYMQHVAFPTHEEAQTCADSCKEIRGAKYETCTLCTDTAYVYWNVNDTEECTNFCPGMRFAEGYKSSDLPIDVSFYTCRSCYFDGLHDSMAQFDIEDCSKICLNHVQVGSECISCDITYNGVDKEIITFGSESLAQECAEKCKGKRYASGKDCISCLTATNVSTPEEATACINNCPNNFVTGNICYSCQYGKTDPYEKITFSTIEEAQECASNCPGDRFAYGSTCFSCTHLATLVFSTEEEAQACGKACGPKRHVEGNKCLFNFVPALQSQTLTAPTETVPPLSE